MQLRPPVFNSAPFDVLRSRIQQPLQANAAGTLPMDALRVARQCANIDNMPGAGVVERHSKATVFHFLLVGRGSGGALPMPNGCDPKVDSTHTGTSRH